MHVGVGSGNPVKVAAVESALGGRFDARVGSVAVDSGVAEQPFGEPETIAGAENRARRVLNSGDGYELGVGLEGGVAEVSGTGGLYLVMWAAVTDGETTGRGAGPQLRLPDHVTRRIRDGEELGPVMDDVLGEDDVAKKQGAAGALTDGIIDRQEALESAVAGALAPFVTDLY
jgi:inosine/xanthosine triphosphatase